MRRLRPAAVVCLTLAGMMLCYGLLFATPADGETKTHVIFLPDWIGVTGILAAAGVLVQWGQIKRQSAETDRELLSLRESVGKAMPRLEFDERINRLADDVSGRFDKMDERLDALFSLFNVERRHGSRGGG